MTREKIIEAIAKAIYCHKGDLPAPWDNVGDGWEGNWSELRMEAQSQAATVLELMRPKRLAWQRGSAVSANGTKYIVAETDFDDGAGEIWYIYVNGKAAGKLGQHNSDHSAQSAAQDHADEQWLTTTPLGELVGGD